MRPHATALEQAMGTPWFVTPIPPDRWHIRDQRDANDRHLVTRLDDGALACDCGEIGCAHVATIRLHRDGRLRAPIEPGYEHLTGLQHQGQAGDDTTTQAPDQTIPPAEGGRKGDKTMSWQDRQYQHADELASYPFVQWVNDPATLDPRADRGGFACPVDQDVSIPGHPAAIHHRGGDVTQVIFAQEITVAVFRTRFAWVTQDGQRHAEYIKGARGKLQALCVAKIPDQAGGHKASDLVMLTFKGLASRHFGNARRTFSQKIRGLAKGKAPAYAFWMTLRAGHVEMAGSGAQSPVTTIELVEDIDPDRDFVGDALLDSLPWSDIKQWAAAWKSPGPNGTGAIEGLDETDATHPTPPQPPQYQEGTVEWATEVGVPLNGQTFKKGAPMGQLNDNALRYISEQKSAEFSTEAKAARILLRAREQARQEPERVPVEEEIPF